MDRTTIVAERRALGLEGYELIDQNGDGIGPVDAAWAVVATGEVALIGLKTGIFSTEAHVVPVTPTKVDAASKAIRVPYTADYIKRGPIVDMHSDIAADKQAAIDQYYGIQTPAPGPAPTQSAMPETGGAGTSAIETSVEEVSLPAEPVSSLETDPLLLDDVEVVVERVDVNPSPFNGWTEPADTASTGGALSGIALPAIAVAVLVLFGALAFILIRRNAQEPPPSRWQRLLDSLPIGDD